MHPNKSLAQELTAVIQENGGSTDIFKVIPDGLREKLRGKIISLCRSRGNIVMITDSFPETEERIRTEWPNERVRIIGGPPLVDMTLEELEDRT